MYKKLFNTILGMDLDDYRKRVVKDGNSLTGVAFVPYRLGENTVFIFYKNMSAGNEVRGPHQQVRKELLIKGIDMDEAKLIPDGRSIGQALKGCSA
jgi:hypothetical protein